jgi:hypothetical protein
MSVTLMAHAEWNNTVAATFVREGGRAGGCACCVDIIKKTSDDG